VGLSHGDLVVLSDGEPVLSLAGELASADGAVVDLVVAVGNGVLHDEVGIRRGSEDGSGRKEGVTERSHSEECGSYNDVQIKNV
jgi:hypothetical protein